MSAMKEVTPLCGIERAAVTAGKGTSGGTSLRIIEEHGIVQVFAAKGQTDAVASQLGISSKPGKASVTSEYTAIPLAPGQWMLHAAGSSADKNGGFCAQLSGRLEGMGYVSEQSHSRVILRLCGNDARKVMQKGCRLDLHPAVASAGFSAQTNMAQTGVILHQLDDEPTYDLMVYSGFAKCFCDWLMHSAAEFDVSVE